MAKKRTRGVEETCLQTKGWEKVFGEAADELGETWMNSPPAIIDGKEITPGEFMGTKLVFRYLPCAEALHCGGLPGLCLWLERLFLRSTERALREMNDDCTEAARGKTQDICDKAVGLLREMAKGEAVDVDAACLSLGLYDSNTRPVNEEPPFLLRHVILDGLVSAGSAFKGDTMGVVGMAAQASRMASLNADVAVRFTELAQQCADVAEIAKELKGERE